MKMKGYAADNSGTGLTVVTSMRIHPQVTDPL